MSSVLKGNLKKPYQRPRLKVYGNIQDVTKTVGNNFTAIPDGGSGGGGMTKTH